MKKEMDISDEMNYKYSIKEIIIIVVFIVGGLPVYCMEEGNRQESPNEGQYSVEKKVQRELIDAIIRGDRDRAIEAVAQGAHVNFADEDDKRLPIHYAAAAGDIAILNWLVQLGCRIEEIDGAGRLPIHHAASTGQLGALRWLIERGADKDATTGDGSHPVHYAARRGHINILEYYASAGNASFLDFTGRHPVHYAARRGHIHVLEFLYQQNVNMNLDDYGGEGPLHYAAFGGHVDVMDWLVKHGADYNALDEADNSLLHFGAEGGHVPVLAWLVERGVPLSVCDRSGRQALHRAASCGRIGALTWLILHGCDIRALDYKFDNVVSHARHPVTLLWLLDHGALVKPLTKPQRSKFERYPLIFAILNGQEDQARILLQTLDWQEHIKEWRQSFLLAIALGHQGIVSYLLERSDEKMTTRVLRAALETAAACSNADAFRLLYVYLRSRVRMGEIEIAEFKSIVENAFEWASVMGSEKVVGFLLEHAIAYEELPDLNVGRMLRRISEIRERATLFREEFRLESIRQRLILVEEIRQGEAMALSESEVHELYGYINLLPPELYMLLMGFALSPG